MTCRYLIVTARRPACWCKFWTDIFTSYIRIMYRWLRCGEIFNDRFILNFLDRDWMRYKKGNIRASVRSSCRQFWKRLTSMIAWARVLSCTLYAILILNKITRSPSMAMVGRPYRLYPKASVWLLVLEKSRFFRVTAVPYTLLWCCYIERYKAYNRR